METLKTMGQRLKFARCEAGLTLKQVSERTGYAVSTLNSIENGHDTPSARLLDKWTTTLGLSVDWVEDGKGDVFFDWDQPAFLAPPKKTMAVLLSDLAFHRQAVDYHGSRVKEIVAEIAAFESNPQKQTRPRPVKPGG